VVPKIFEVILSRRSDKMLLSHTEFLARVSPAAARKLLSDFKKVTKKLTDNPFQFPFADELDALSIPPETYRKSLFYARYKALFVIEKDVVYIDAIIDCRQENKNLFREEEDYHS